MRRYFKQLPAIREDEILAAIRQWAFPLNSKEDLQPLFDRIGNARIVMLGEASHGTHEYYTWRAHITQRLILEKGFNLIAVEGDWPDAYRLNRFIKGYDESGTSPLEVLHNFNRWPTWMWANWEMVGLATWLRQLNTGLPFNERVAYGNYVPSVLPLRYDAFIHFEETMALYPLHIEPEGEQIPETYPFGV